MGVEFTVSPAEVADMAGHLQGLKEEFDGLEDHVGRYRSTEVCGHEHVGDKLGDFADNWSDKKREMNKKLESLAQYAQAAADAYSQVEGEISGAFEEGGS
jgi:hypothetical protein